MPRSRGPIITTNFDPLVEVAIRDGGGQPSPLALDSDGTIMAGDASGIVDVLHVHGYWRRGDTLHTVAQLTVDRPQLAGAIREALRGCLVAVVGYGGWKDAFTNTLVERVRENNPLGMEVLWGSYTRIDQTLSAEGAIGGDPKSEPGQLV